MRGGRVGGLVGGAVTVLLTLTACGSSSPGATGSPTVTATTATSASTDASPTTGGGSATPTAPSSTSATTSAPVTPPNTTSPTTPTGSAATTPTTTPDPHQPRCTAAALKVSALRGSGAQQKQYATVFATNAGAQPCWVVGYVSVTLRAGGSALGRPATPAGPDQPALRLAVGARAQALVHGSSACQAGVSDTLRISIPGQSTFTDAPVPMRACPLVVDALTAAGT